MAKNIYKKIRGFSLIETLIAITILMIAITGPLTLVQSGLFSSNHARNQITATYLAQEGLEFIRSARDANSYSQYGNSPTSWLTGPDGTSLLTSCPNTTGCFVDPHKGLLNGGIPAFIQTVTGANQSLKLTQKSETSSGIFTGYGYETSGAVGYTYTPTTFGRVIKITPVANTSNEVTVTVTVTWSDNGLARSYTVSENLVNYQIASASIQGPIVLNFPVAGNPAPSVFAIPNPPVYKLISDVTFSDLTIQCGATLDTNGFVATYTKTPNVCDSNSIVDNSGNVNVTNPGYCGDGNINQAGEQCDGTNLGGIGCGVLGFGSGFVTCNSRCMIDTSRCADPLVGGGTYE